MNICSIYILTWSIDNNEAFVVVYNDFIVTVKSNKQARFSCKRCEAGGYFVPARGALWAHEVTLINFKGYNIINTSDLLL